MPGMDAGGGIGLLWLVYVLPLVIATLGYLGAVRLIHRRGGRWPARRTLSWCAGLLAAAIAVIGSGRSDFTAHMTGHLLLGMAAPVLLVLAAPITLGLRALPVARARRLPRFLKTWPLRILTHLVTAAVLDVGGLWALYTTGIYSRMADHAWLHALVSVHTGPQNWKPVSSRRFDVPNGVTPGGDPVEVQAVGEAQPALEGPGRPLAAYPLHVVDRTRGAFGLDVQNAGVDGIESQHPETHLPKTVHRCIRRTRGARLTIRPALGDFL